MCALFQYPSAGQLSQQLGVGSSTEQTLRPYAKQDHLGEFQRQRLIIHAKELLPCAKKLRQV
jgi:hypothetical protein